MGFIRQSKIAGYQLGAYAGNKPTTKAKQRYAGWVAGEAKDKADKAAKKAKRRRRLGNMSQKARSILKRLSN